MALNFMSNHVASYKPAQLARNKQSIMELEKDLVVQQPYIPLAALPGVLPSLRNGDISRAVAHMGLL